MWQSSKARCSNYVLAAGLCSRHKYQIQADYADQQSMVQQVYTFYVLGFGFAEGLVFDSIGVHLLQVCVARVDGLHCLIIILVSLLTNQFITQVKLTFLDILSLCLHIRHEEVILDPTKSCSGVKLCHVKYECVDREVIMLTIQFVMLASQPMM